MQLRVVHTTTFTYEGEAAASYNQARLTPLTDHEQIVVYSVVDVSPKPWTFEYRDYFGSAVTAFEVFDPHKTMTVKATSTTQTGDQPELSAVTTWQMMEAPGIFDRWTEYLTLPPLVAPPDDLADRARQIKNDTIGPGAAARAIVSMIHEEIELTPGVTSTSSPAEDAWTERAGVAQDLVHLTLACLRTIGIPARYVSGYVHPDAQPEVGVTRESDPHAWVEWWEGGWQPWDVTTTTPVDHRYVKVAAGRDYTDVKPISGIYSGADTASMDVSVEITRIF